MMSHTLAVRGWAYDHQIKEVIGDLCDLLTDDFSKVFGIAPAPLFRLFHTLIEKVNDKIVAHRNKLRKVLSNQNYNDIFEAYEKEFPHLIKTDQVSRDSMWEHFGKNLEYTRVAMMTHADLCLDQLFTFTTEEMVAYTENKLSKDQIVFVFDKLSYRFGELKDFNTEHFILDNPVHKKPFIKLDEEKYFSSFWSHLPHISIRLLETLVSEDVGLNSDFKCRAFSPE